MNFLPRLPIMKCNIREKTIPRAKNSAIDLLSVEMVAEFVG
jgi:hypothetical protein